MAPAASGLAVGAADSGALSFARTHARSLARWLSLTSSRRLVEAASAPAPAPETEIATGTGTESGSETATNDHVNTAAAPDMTSGTDTMFGSDTTTETGGISAGEIDGREREMTGTVNVTTIDAGGRTMDIEGEIKGRGLSRTARL